jgi:hypothetical protein
VTAPDHQALVDDHAPDGDFVPLGRCLSQPKRGAHPLFVVTD